MTTIIRKNPKEMPAPVGNYSHVTVVPAGATWYAFSGQIGSQADGTISADGHQEITQTFANIKLALEAEGLTASDIVKVNIWAVDEIDWDYFYEAWDKLFAVAYPSMTIAYVTALGLPEIRLEIDITAAKV